VVADTTPLNYLILIGQAHVLGSLFRRVLVPERRARGQAMHSQYTEHLPDHTNRRVQISLHMNNVRAARAKLAVLLSSNSTAPSAPVLQKAA
jgi:hypothetical protein